MLHRSLAAISLIVVASATENPPAEVPADAEVVGAGFHEAKWIGDKWEKTEKYKQRIIRGEVPVAKAVNISDPIFTCPKPGYILVGEDCVYTSTIPARFECPTGYIPLDIQLGRPSLCERRVDSQLTCPNGSRLIDGKCVKAEFTEPLATCPPGTERQDMDGDCIRYEPVHPIEICPPGSNKVGHRCLVVEYAEPTYVCPLDTIQEGKKCRREVVAFKEKLDKNHRKLTTEVEFDAENIGEQDMGEGQGTWEWEDGKRDWERREWERKPNWSGNWEEEYLEVKKKPRAYEWKKVQVPLPYIEEEKVIVKKAEPKATTVKVVKVRPQKEPQQIIKVQMLPAEKVCREGSEKHGGACVTQIEVPPSYECPVQLVKGRCLKKIVIPPITTCLAPATLVCPPHIPGKACKCESKVEFPPTPVCTQGSITPDQKQCVSLAEPREFCPIGYFLEKPRRTQTTPVPTPTPTCVKRDVEPALCIFSVTYICPDCDNKY